MSRDFWIFWTGRVISSLGAFITLFALPLLVFEITGSALNLALTAAAAFLPYPIFGLVIGAWVDRLNRKRLMISTDLARAAIIASIPAMAVADLLNVWWIYAVAFVNTTLKICFDAGEFAALPSLVSKERLVWANGRVQAGHAASRILGPMVGGLLLIVIPIQALLLADALTFLVSAITLALIRTDFDADPTGGERPTIMSSIAEGLRYVWSHPVLRNISLLVALFNFVSTTTLDQLVFFAKQQFVASDTQVGLFYSAGGVGIVLLSLISERIRASFSFGTIILGSLVLSGGLITTLAVTPLYWTALPLWALILGVNVLFSINVNSLRQTIVPGQLLGRVQTTSAVLAWSAIPLGTLLGGLLIEWTQSVALVYAGIGVIIVFIAGAFFFTALGNAERHLAKQLTEE